ncbi:outer membrane protein assembly factor BamD [Castellaniella caeni]|uniref:outer membrane protein assembly factor BamD n=1 Tax=Castellaniella caeni TaxID=266123 RepID=UPI0008330C3A|nr:outer membrane protein assembly factor BamD [Castellaniella caeni]
MKSLPSTARLALAGLCLALVAGCSSTSGNVDPTAGWSAERLYSQAKSDISSGSWSEARKNLEALEARYPFGIYAQQSLIDQAYVNWKDEEPEQAKAAIDRFMQQYPNHPGTDYMLYLKGMITFTPPSAVLSNITRQDPSERDPKGLRESYEAFNELIKRYPDSRYAPDARKRVAWLVNTIAENEVHIAQYYYERGAYVAAANRAQTVVTDFQGAPVVEKALYLMMLSYQKLDLPNLAEDAKRVLDKNFPDSKYYKQGLKGEVNNWNPVNWL